MIEPLILRWRLPGETTTLAEAAVVAPVGLVAWGTPVEWTTGDDYVASAPASVVSFQGEGFVCLIDHTAGVFADDLDDGKWISVSPRGIQGKSAYEVAVENGFSGDETAWLASLGGIVPWATTVPWTTGVAWHTAAPTSTVSFGGSSYLCLVDHVSGVFADDYLAGKWEPIAVKGDTPTLTVGDVTGGAPGSDPVFTLTETDPGIYTVDVTLPVGGDGNDGDPGPAPTLNVGTVTAGAAGSDPAFVLTLTAPGVYRVDVTLPRGAKGDAGATGWSAVDPLASGVTLTPALGTALDFSMTLTGNVTVANPTGATSGMTFVIELVQDVTGGRLATFGPAYKFPGGIAPILSSAPNARDLLFGLVRADGTVFANLERNYA